jgi:hypothetical protein
MSRSVTRRIRRICQPVILGQRALGFWAAAILIFCWQGTRTLQAAALAPQGYSENDNIRLEWDYDLAAGTGTLWIHSVEEILYFGKISLYTKGMTLDSITVTSNPENTYFAGPMDAGTEDGQNLHEYAYENPMAEDPFWRWYPGFWGLSAVTACFHQEWNNPSVVYDYPARIDVTFPAEGVGLYESKLDYSGLLSGAPGLVFLADQQIPFVSVEAIPEPSTVALLGLGAIGAAAAGVATNKRKEK